MILVPPLPIAVPRIELDSSQKAALGAMQRGDNVFLTGRAGTGKSTVTAAFLGQAFRKVDVTASTGVAALNLRDLFQARSGILIAVSTVFRWGGIQLGPKDAESDALCMNRLAKDMIRSRVSAWQRIKNAQCLVIDEISMLTGRTFQFLEFLCRTLRGIDKPWGGVQVVCVGDFLQLPPVARDGKYDWCFQNPAWGKTGFRNCVLQEIHRQADPDFMDLLNAIRIGRVSAAHQKMLATRVARFPSKDLLRLFTHNIQVDKWNDSMLGAIESPAVEFHMTSDGGPECDWIKKNLLTPEVLTVKMGARVMVTVNLSDGAGGLLAVNGSLGTVVTWMNDFGEEIIRVRLDDGTTLDIGRYKWRVDGTKKDGPGVSQYPLKLAWAATIHKSQGLSLDSALIDARATREPGQTYTALSRVRSFSGLWLRDVFQGVWISPEAVEFMRGL